MKIKELKESNRPIEKLIKFGPKALSNEELLSILINTGTKDKSCIELATDIINSLDDLNDLTKLNIIQLTKFKGIKNKKAALIVASIELAKRSFESYGTRKAINNNLEVYELLRPKILNLGVEHIFVFYLDSKYQILKEEEIESPNPNMIILPKRGIIKNAINVDAVYILIAHNHPSQNINPSADDIKATKDLSNALKLLNIRLIDHLVLSRKSFVSLKDYIDF